MITVGNRKNGDEGVYVGRPTPMGNPFSHLPYSAATVRVTTREEAIERYREWITTSPQAEKARVFVEETAKKTARGLDICLVCWCAPFPCHADVLKDLIEKRSDEITEKKTGELAEKNDDHL